MRIAYFDGASGASGDMILGALLDAGVDLDELRSELRALPIDGYALRAERVTRAGIAATMATVETAGGQEHRDLADIRSLLDTSSLAPDDRGSAMSVFARLAAAEAAAHGIEVDDVHFHEVGAVDAIVDVVGAVVGLRLLGVERVFSAPLVVGSGVARAEHGELPVPAPGTLRLIAEAGAPVAPARQEPAFEALTPTGAALLTTLAVFDRPAMRLTTIGYGAGRRDTPSRPNVLRLWLGETLAEPAATPAARLLLFESNIDDMSPELYGWVQEQLFAAGALDVWFAPIQMKKNRPATLLSAIAPPGDEAAIVRTFLRETSTLGVRVRDVWRHEAERHSFAFVSSLGEVRAKARILPDGAIAAAPEHESCREIADAKGLPLIDVAARLATEAQHEAERRFGLGRADAPAR